MYGQLVAFMRGQQRGAVSRGRYRRRPGSSARASRRSPPLPHRARVGGGYNEPGLDRDAHLVGIVVKHPALGPNRPANAMTAWTLRSAGARGVPCRVRYSGEATTMRCRAPTRLAIASFPPAPRCAPPRRAPPPRDRWDGRAASAPPKHQETAPGIRSRSATRAVARTGWARDAHSPRGALPSPAAARSISSRSASTRLAPARNR